MERHLGQKLIFFFMMFIFEILLWTVKIFMMTGRDFHDYRSRFLWWQVEVSVMTGWDFLDDGSRFSWWQVKIFMMTGRDFIINYRDFHDDRSWFYYELSRFFFSFLVLIKETRMGDESNISHSCFWRWLRKLGGRVSARVLCVTPVLESFPSDLLQAITNYWAEVYLEPCRKSTMEFICKNS